jgi:hypothetical protein
MRRFIIIFLAALEAPSLAFAEPLVTISCDQPKGVTMQYGTSFGERLQAYQDKRPEPKSSFKEPTPDRYLGKPTFVIDSTERKLTVLWAESPDQIELREEAKKRNLPTLPGPQAIEVAIIAFTNDQITAVEAMPFAAMMYSFFPKLGVAFLVEQHLDLGLKNAIQLATFASCEFSWNKLQ